MENIQSTKKTDIVNTAKKLFYRHGIKRVTVEEICREANVSKMTFYNYFDNKNNLVKYIVKTVFEANLKRYQKIMAEKISYPLKVKEIIKMKLEQVGDLSQEFARDLMQSPDRDIAEFYSQKIQESMHITLKDFTDAQKRGDIRSDIKPEFLLYISLQLREMFLDKELFKLYDSSQKLISELINFFFYGILPHDED